MSYQLFPIAPGRSNPFSFSVNRPEQRYGEGGIVERPVLGKNVVSHTVEVSLNTERRSLVQSFLMARKEDGEPFRLDWKGDGSDRSLYICTDWSWTWLRSGTVWSLSLSLQQVFRPDFP